MKYLIDFVVNTTEQSISDWMTANNIVNPTKLNSLDLYIVDAATLPQKTDIVDQIKVDENISNQLLNDSETITQPSNETSTFNHHENWWMTAAAFDVDFTSDTTTFERRGSKTNVYIVDSGISSHIEFQNAKIQNLFSFNNNFDDTNGHGTALASVVVGHTLGITSSTLKVVKVFDNTKTTMISDLIKAFDAILQDIISNQSILPIVNLSWSIPKNDYVELKLQELINAGAMVIVAAGNDGTPIQNVTPASMESVITIGAYTDNFVPADFTNYTSTIKNTPNATNYGALDGWAPGVNIKAALIDGTVGLISGTSIATAIMSACAAYNSDLLYTNESYTPDSSNFVQWATFAKTGILTLSDKYEGSKNVVSTFATKAWQDAYAGARQIAKVIYNGEDVYCYLAPNAFISKLELNGDLPDGLTLSNGWIVGKLANSPTNTTTLTYEATITFTTGKVNTFPITLFLAPADAKIGEMPKDVPAHPALLCVECSDCTKGCYCNGCR